MEEISLLPAREFPDSGAKWLLESPENVSGLLQILAPNLEKCLDFKRLHDEKKSFVLDTLRKQESDQVFLAPFKEETSGIEREIFIFILIEHQSKPIKSMGFRMLFYMTLIWDAQRRRWEDDGVPESLWRFRPILPILFYTGERNWDTQLSIKELMDLPAELECFVPQHETLFLNLNATEPEKLTASGHPFGWILRIIQNESAPIEKLLIELKEAVENIDRLTTSERIQWQRAMYYILLLIYHRRSSEEHEQLTDIVISKVQDRRRQEEVSKMGRTIAQSLIEEGEQRGLEKGKLETTQSNTLDVLITRFTVPYATLTELKERIKRIEDASVLRNLLTDAVKAESLNDFVKRLDGLQV